MFTLPDHSFQEMYALRSQDLQGIQNYSIILDRPNITVLSKTKFKRPIFILEVLSSPNEDAELKKLILYMLIVHEMYGLREVYGALTTAEKIRCLISVKNEVSFASYNFLCSSYNQKSCHFGNHPTLTGHFVNNTPPQNLDANSSRLPIRH